MTDIQPWYVLDAEIAGETRKGMSKRYSSRVLIPFAARQDNDDVACWEIGRGEAVVVIHDFASPGWEVEAEFPSFHDWLRRAFEDFIEWSELGE